MGHGVKIDYKIWIVIGRPAGPTRRPQPAGEVGNVFLLRTAWISSVLTESSHTARAAMLRQFRCRSGLPLSSPSCLSDLSSTLDHSDSVDRCGTDLTAVVI